MTRTRARAPDLSGTHLWLVMMKAHRALQRLAIQSIESFEVGLSEFGVLEMLLHKGPQSLNEIGRRIGLTSGAITAAVDRLESCELVARSCAAGASLSVLRPERDGANLSVTTDPGKLSPTARSWQSARAVS